MKRKFGRASRSYLRLAVFMAALLILCAAANIFLDYPYAIGVVEAAAALLVICAAAYSETKRRNEAENYIRSVTKTAGSIPGANNSTSRDKFSAQAIFSYHAT